jgi:hypothetical protein
VSRSKIVVHGFLPKCTEVEFASFTPPAYPPNMPIQISDIQPDDWSPFFDELTRNNRGRIVSLNMDRRDAADHIHVQDVPLEGMALALHGNEEVISIVLREHTLHHKVYTVHQPWHVMYEHDNGVARSLHIESEDRRKTVVRFESVSVPEAVQAQTITEEPSPYSG